MISIQNLILQEFSNNNNICFIGDYRTDNGFSINLDTKKPCIIKAFSRTNNIFWNFLNFRNNYISGNYIINDINISEFRTKQKINFLYGYVCTVDFDFFKNNKLNNIDNYYLYCYKLLCNNLNKKTDICNNVLKKHNFDKIKKNFDSYSNHFKIWFKGIFLGLISYKKILYIPDFEYYKLNKNELNIVFNIYKELANDGYELIIFQNIDNNLDDKIDGDDSIYWDDQIFNIYKLDKKTNKKTNKDNIIFITTKKFINKSFYLNFYEYLSISLLQLKNTWFYTIPLLIISIILGSIFMFFINYIDILSDIYPSIKMLIGNEKYKYILIASSSLILYMLIYFVINHFCLHKIFKLNKFLNNLHIQKIYYNITYSINHFLNTILSIVIISITFIIWFYDIGGISSLNNDILKTFFYIYIVQIVGCALNIIYWLLNSYKQNVKINTIRALYLKENKYGKKIYRTRTN